MAKVLIWAVGDRIRPYAGGKYWFWRRWPLSNIKMTRVKSPKIMWN